MTSKNMVEVVTTEVTKICNGYVNEILNYIKNYVETGNDLNDLNAETIVADLNLQVSRSPTPSLPGVNGTLTISSTPASKSIENPCQWQMSRGARKGEHCGKECWVHPSERVYPYCRDCLRKEQVQKILPSQGFPVPTDDDMKKRAKSIKAPVAPKTNKVAESLRPNPQNGRLIDVKPLGTSGVFCWTAAPPHCVIYRHINDDGTRVLICMGELDPKTFELSRDLSEESLALAKEKKFAYPEDYQELLEDKLPILESDLEYMKTKSPAPTVSLGNGLSNIMFRPVAKS